MANTLNTTAKKDDVPTGVDEQPGTLATEVGHFTPEQLYGSHYNQKFGNLPENPKTAPGLPDPDHEDLDDKNSTQLAHKTNNLPGVGSAFIRVHNDMVGDYLRAGWHIADASDINGGGGDSVGQGEGPTDDKDGEKAAVLTAQVGTSGIKAAEIDGTTPPAA